MIFLLEKRILQINITQRCNLNCIYCYETKRSPTKPDVISFENATAAIQSFLAGQEDSAYSIIELSGGEPLLYPDLVKRIVEWTLAKFARLTRRFHFSIDSNGTLLTEEINTWLYAHRHHVVLAISLDGTPAAHNANRSGSYDLVAPHLPFIARTWPSTPCKMTISQRTVGDIFEGIVHLTNLGFLVAANVPMEDIWGGSAEKRLYLKQFTAELDKLVDYYAKNPDLPLPSIIDLPISLIDTADHHRPWCGSGRNMIAVDVDGRYMSCSRYSFMSFNPGLLRQKKPYTASVCSQCRFLPACQTCEVLNWQVNGHPDNRTTYHCEFTKAQVWATAQIHAIRLESLARRLLSANEQSQERQKLAAISSCLEKIASILGELERDQTGQESVPC